MIGRLCWIGVLLCLGALAQAQASYYKPGWNLYTPEQDIELGQKAAQQAQQQLPILRDPEANQYVSNLGLELAGHMPGPRFPYNFHIVSQPDINAFALPGGPIFVNLGALCAAENEAQLAGVLAHEGSHVALRHSTAMLSKQQAASLPLGILGGIFNSGVGQLASLGAQLAVGGVLLKYSRDMESQADALGAQVMHAAGYDPRQMARFFELLEAQGGQPAAQFLSSHPNPGNRRAAIEAEIPNLGPHPAYHDNSAVFVRVRAELCGGTQPGQGGGKASFQGASFTVPAGWQAYGDQTSQLTLVPANGLSPNAGATDVVRGAIVSTTSGSREQLIAELRRSNPHMQPQAGSERPVAAGNLHGTEITLANRNADNHPEADLLVFLPRSGADTLYFIFVAPASEFAQFRPVFDQILNSLRPAGA